MRWASFHCICERWARFIWLTLLAAGRLPCLRYRKSWAHFAFRQSRAGFRLSDELMDSLQITKFSSAVGVSGAYANEKAETHSWLRKKIAFNSCFNRSLLGTQPVEVLGMEQGLDLSSPKFHRTAKESPFTAAIWNICALEHMVQRKIFWEPCFAVDVFETSLPFFLEIPKNDSQEMKISEQQAQISRNLLITKYFFGKIPS